MDFCLIKRDKCRICLVDKFGIYHDKSAFSLGIARNAISQERGITMTDMELDVLTEFDEKLWLTVIDTVTIHTDGRMTFKFQGGKTFTSY